MCFAVLSLIFTLSIQVLLERNQCNVLCSDGSGSTDLESRLLRVLFYNAALDSLPNKLFFEN